MSCQALMDSNPATLYADTPIEEGMKALLDRHLSAMPVIDRDGRYLGMLGVRKLLGLMLPSVALLEDLEIDLSFVSDRIEDFRTRLKEIRGHPIQDYLQTEGPILRPETSIMEAILLLCRSRNIIPVVDAKTEKLLGTVSSWQALQAIQGS